jgi:hypothetical protein
VSGERGGGEKGVKKELRGRVQKGRWSVCLTPLRLLLSPPLTSNGIFIKSALTNPHVSVRPCPMRAL